MYSSLPNQQAQVSTNHPNRPNIYGQSIDESIQSMTAIHIHREWELPNYQHKLCPKIKCKASNQIKFHFNLNKHFSTYQFPYWWTKNSFSPSIQLAHNDFLYVLWFCICGQIQNAVNKFLFW